MQKNMDQTHLVHTVENQSEKISFYEFESRQSVSISEFVRTIKVNNRLPVVIVENIGLFLRSSLRADVFKNDPVNYNHCS